MSAPEKITPAEEAWLAEAQKGWAPLDEFQATVIRRHFRVTATDLQDRGAA